MKVLMITGASRAVVWFRQEMIAYLKAKGHDITVVSCDSDHALQIEALGVDFICAGSNNREIGVRSNLKYTKTIKDICNKIRPDKVITFQAKANTFGVIAASQAKAKDITSMVEGLGRAYKSKGGLKNDIAAIILRKLYKVSIKKIKTLIVLNDENRQTLLKTKSVKESQILQINGIGVDINEYTPVNDNCCDKIAFAMIARVEKDKGVIEYCEAAKILKKEFGQQVEFNYYGSCDDSENIVLQYAADVNYKGYVNDPKSIYASNKVIVLPSYHEGVPRSLIEAAACGRAIIATDIPGCKVVVEDEVNGLLCKIKDVDSLVSAIRQLIEDPKKIEKMGKEGRKIAEKNFDSDIINQQIYERVFN